MITVVYWLLGAGAALERGAMWVAGKEKMEVNKREPGALGVMQGSARQALLGFPPLLKHRGKIAQECGAMFCYAPLTCLRTIAPHP